MQQDEQTGLLRQRWLKHENESFSNSIDTGAKTHQDAPSITMVSLKS